MTKAPYDVTLSQLDDGSVLVRVGCKTMAYKSLDQLAKDIELYFLTPEPTIDRISKLHGWVVGAEVPGPRPWDMPAPSEPLRGINCVGRVSASEAELRRF